MQTQITCIFKRERERDYFNPIICPKILNVYRTYRIICEYKLIATKVYVYYHLIIVKKCYNISVLGAFYGSEIQF